MTRRFSFKDLSIGRKLLLACLLVTAVTLTVLSTVSIARQTIDWREDTLASLLTSTEIMAANTGPALLFNDPQAAHDTLSTFSAMPEVAFAGLYDPQGKLYASYGEAAKAPARHASTTVQYSFERDALVVTKPVMFNGERVGSIYVRADLRTLYASLLRQNAFTVVSSLAAFVLAGMLFLRMQRRIVRPIADLSDIMDKVSSRSDYAMRAPDGGGDEVGVLARSFNAMLEAIQQRDLALAQHQAQLEAMVRQRTAQLEQANEHLEDELQQRKAAQEALHAHDSMLKAVTHGAAELLGELNLDEAITRVLELMGQTMDVSRVHLCPIATDREGHLRMSISHEWCGPGLDSIMAEAAFKDVDLTMDFPELAAASLLGERSVLRPDMAEAAQPRMERLGARSGLFIPVMSEGRLWGGLGFTDMAEGRDWSWAETDTLTTLSTLIGSAITRARYVKELADANTIVQNSPTVLYRLKGEPNLRLTYVSHNITKFGYDAKRLAANADRFFQTLVHPEDLPKVLEAMANLVEKNAKSAAFEYRLMLPSGAWRWVENRCSPVRDEVGRLVEIEGIVIDVTERKAAEKKIALLARTDPLTGLANRATFAERLHQAYAAARRGGPPFAVLCLDLDHFKDVNDTRGHPAGDALLKQAAERLHARVRETDVVARLGGDEFAILQTDMSDPSDAGALASAVVASLSAPFTVDGAELRVSASMGISPYNPDTESADSMLSQADLALYRAKEEGRNQFRFHSVELDRQVSERVAIGEDLRHAIEHGELKLHYQPQVELMTGRIVGMEALIRWLHPTRGLLRPVDFIPIAEATGVIHKLGRWVLENACRQMRAWRDEGLAPPVIAVNVSMLQLKNGAEFVRDVCEVLAETGLQPGELELDVTESMLARVTLAQNEVLDRLREMGVKIALDDFGADYSSFGYLRAYRVHHLKVARRFVENATQDPAQAATVRAIIGAAKELGIQVIAEGVETQDQRALLLSLNAGARGQGFYFSEPVEAEHATELLQKGSIDHADEQPTAA